MPHRCYRKVVRCDIVDEDMVLLASKENVCESSCVGACARDVHGYHSGEGYDLCGPPIHAEVLAIDELIRKDRLDEEGLTAYISGNDYVCRACHIALRKAGIKRIVMT